jgi:hypothetical protein
MQTKRNFAAGVMLKNSPASPRFQIVAAAKRRVKYGAAGDFQVRQHTTVSTAVAAAETIKRIAITENWISTFHRA